MLKKLLIPVMLMLLAIEAFAVGDGDSLLMTLDSDVSGIDIHILSESPQFCLVWTDSTGNGAGINVVRQNNMFDDKDMSCCATFTLFSLNGNVKSDIAQTKAAYDGDFCALRIKKSPDISNIYGGRNTAIFSGTVPPLTLKNGTSFNVTATANGKIKIVRCAAQHYKSLGSAQFADAKQLHEYLHNSCDSLEGYWDYLDYSTDNSGVRIAHSYKLATVKSGDKYYIINLDSTDTWQPLMARGHLYPTPFIDHFDLEWIDSKRINLFNRDTSASFSQNGTILTLSFPLLGAQLRLKRQ